MAFSSKHLLNDPKDLVLDSLKGLCRINPNLALDETQKVVVCKTRDESKVAIICGGGSGHEPAHSGFVGEGMLTAAVCGNVFASPNASQVQRAIEVVDSENSAGVLVIVKSYTGDILNFGLAKEQYAAAHPERASKIKVLLVGDDVSVGRTQGALVGRRGLAGTVLVYKIAGALARTGASLVQVHELASYVSNRLGTVGVGLEHCHVPGTAASHSSYLAEDEVEIGMGIHNEPGHSRSKLTSLSVLIPSLLDMITRTDDPERSFVPFKHDGADRAVLLVNNLGSVSELELGAVVGETLNAVTARGITIDRVISGTIMTSLNMPGFSITLLLLPRPGEEAPYDANQILGFLDDVPDVPGWRSAHSVPPKGIAPITLRPSLNVAARGQFDRVLGTQNREVYLAAIRRACEAVAVAEPELTEMDRIAGDGDCGLTLKNGATSILKRLEQGDITGEDVIQDVRVISSAVNDAMDGTSGALYSIFFSSLAQGLYEACSPNNNLANRTVWSVALSTALTRLYNYTLARPPSRTLVDPLDAFISALQQDGIPYQDAVQRAGEAAEATKYLAAKAGRAAYVEAEKFKGVADPGAKGVQYILEALFLV